MDHHQQKLESDRQLLSEARQKGSGALLGAFLKLSGPGWLQSAMTLGGGSLASSLYLGVLGGYSLLWVQPLAMILGIIMLSAIGCVTLSTQERPLQAINNHVNPVLGWGWVAAVAVANVVWCLPQYSLSNGVLSQNLLPGLLGQEGAVCQAAAASLGSDNWIAQNANKLLVAISVLLICTAITWSYDRAGWGVRLYEGLLKLMVAVIVLCFFGVVIVLSMSEEPLDWGAVWAGLIPDFSQFQQPAATFLPLLNEVGPLGDSARQYWSNVIVTQQRDVLISAAATAVGINMTFLFPYSLLRRGWTREFRGLAIFDLATGMFIPYLLATSCIVIASAAQFHTQIDPGFVIEDGQVTPPGKFATPYQQALADRAQNVDGEIGLSEKKLAATLVNRDAMDLAKSLAPLTGNFIANIVFGVGVLAMTMSTISLLMLVSGFVVCEILGQPQGGWSHRLGTLLAGVGGALGPFIWGKASFYLAVPTSVFAFVLLPFAYVTFVLLMNQKSLLGPDAPRGGRRWLWNVLMGVAAGVATIGSVYMIWIKAHGWGIAAVGALVLLAVVVHLAGGNRHRQSWRLNHE